LAYKGRRTISTYRNEYGYALDPLGGRRGRDAARFTWPTLLVVLAVIAVACVTLFAWRYGRTHSAAGMGLMRTDAPIARTSGVAAAVTLNEGPRHEIHEAAMPRLAVPTPVAPPASVPSAPSAATRDADVVMFGNRPIRPVRTMRMVVTAYSPDERSCGKWADGITASGKSVWTNGMRLVAADTRLLPFGSIVSVPGYNGGRPVPVLDRGGAIKGKRLDVLYPTHEIALRWGRQPLDVTIWEYAD
jgi:3D (Asp-Asp-Asp) domain-containing protein